MSQNTTHFPDIENLVQSRQQKGARLECTFACPVSGKSQRSTVDVVAANDGALATKARFKLRSAAVRSLSRNAGKALRSLFGSNAVGRLANEVATDKGRAAEAEGGFTTEELERATVVAFESVANQFVHSEEHGGFVHRSVVDAARR